MRDGMKKKTESDFFSDHLYRQYPLLRGPNPHFRRQPSTAPLSAEFHDVSGSSAAAGLPWRAPFPLPSVLWSSKWKKNSPQRSLKWKNQKKEERRKQFVPHHASLSACRPSDAVSRPWCGETAWWTPDPALQTGNCTFAQTHPPCPARLPPPRNPPQFPHTKEVYEE